MWHARLRLAQDGSGTRVLARLVLSRTSGRSASPQVAAATPALSSRRTKAAATIRRPVGRRRGSRRLVLRTSALTGLSPERLASTLIGACLDFRASGARGEQDQRVVRTREQVRPYGRLGIVAIDLRFALGRTTRLRAGLTPILSARVCSVVSRRTSRRSSGFRLGLPPCSRGMGSQSGPRVGARPWRRPSALAPSQRRDRR